jgi:type VI secretion system secreted protein Hcp
MTTPPQFRPTLLALATLLAVGVGHAQASTQYYLQVGNIKGTSTQEDHRDWNVIDSFQWGLSNPTSISTGGGGGGGSLANFSDFHWTQPIDLSISALFKHAATGKPMDKATLHATTLLKDKEFTFFEMVFDKPLLTSLQLSGATGGVPYLNASFSYKKITMTYFTLDDKGKTPTKFEGMYDLESFTGSLAGLSMAYGMGMMGPTVVSSVPEAETWAMLLAGIGLIGFAARRQGKRQARLSVC